MAFKRKAADTSAELVTAAAGPVVPGKRIEPDFERVEIRGGLTALAITPTAQADTASNFYTGKQLRILVGYGAGGGYDTVTRLMGKNLSKHIPGNPVPSHTYSLGLVPRVHLSIAPVSAMDPRHKAGGLDLLF
jgi:hypothetical protein